MEYSIPEPVRRALAALNGAGHEAYLVGGCVRDLLRGEPPHDWDICTSALPEETLSCFSRRRVLKNGLRHGTVTVLSGDMSFEVTTFRSDGPYSDGRHPDRVRFVLSLDEDLARRDFTINSIALDADGRLHDPFDGRADIGVRLVRCVGRPELRFCEDGLRIMRALRFAATLGYTVEEQTARALHEHRDILRQVAAERISAELCRLLCGAGAARVLREFPDVLRVFWPESGGIPPDELERTLRALDAAPAELLPRLTLLLRPLETGKAEDLLRRLRFGNATLRSVTALLEGCGTTLAPDAGTVRRLLGRLGPGGFQLLLAIRRAEAVAAGEPPDALNAAGALAGEIIAQKQCCTLRELAVTGKDLTEAGIPAGPQVGLVLNALLDKVLDGKLPNDRAALLHSIGVHP